MCSGLIGALIKKKKLILLPRDEQAMKEMRVFSGQDISGDSCLSYTHVQVYGSSYSHIFINIHEHMYQHHNLICFFIISD